MVIVHPDKDFLEDITGKLGEVNFVRRMFSPSYCSLTRVFYAFGVVVCRFCNRASRL